MHSQSLSPTETRLLQAFRALPAMTQKQMLHTLETLREALEDEQDVQDAENILARIRSGEEETIPFDEVVTQLGLQPKAHRGKK